MVYEIINIQQGKKLLFTIRVGNSQQHAPRDFDGDNQWT